MNLSGAQIVDDRTHPQGSRVLMLDIPGLRVVVPRSQQRAFLSISLKKVLQLMICNTSDLWLWHQKISL